MVLIKKTIIAKERAAQFGASPCSGLSFFIRINHNSFAFGIIFPVETEAKLLIKLDRVTVILIYTEVYGIARILHVQFGKQGKHCLLSVSFPLVFSVNKQPVQP